MVCVWVLEEEGKISLVPAGDGNGARRARSIIFYHTYHIIHREHT